MVEVDLESIDVEEQRRLLEEAAARATKRAKIDNRASTEKMNKSKSQGPGSSKKSILSYFIK